MSQRKNCRQIEFSIFVWPFHSILILNSIELSQCTKNIWHAEINYLLQMAKEPTQLAYLSIWICTKCCLAWKKKPFDFINKFQLWHVAKSFWRTIYQYLSKIIKRFRLIGYCVIFYFFHEKLNFNIKLKRMPKVTRFGIKLCAIVVFISKLNCVVCTNKCSFI